MQLVPAYEKVGVVVNHSDGFLNFPDGIVQLVSNVCSANGNQSQHDNAIGAEVEFFNDFAQVINTIDAIDRGEYPLPSRYYIPPETIKTLEKMSTWRSKGCLKSCTHLMEL